MSYRIQVQPEAGTLLRTLAPHLVLRLGSALAQLAEAIASGEEVESGELRVDDCVVQFALDRAQHLLLVEHIEQREELAPAFAMAEATA